MSLTAEQAKGLTKKAIKASVDFKSIDHQILEATRGGRWTASIDISNLPSHVTSSYIKQVKAHYNNLGFKVEHESGYDPRDGDGWNNLTISWA